MGLIDGVQLIVWRNGDIIVLEITKQEIEMYIRARAKMGSFMDAENDETKYSMNSWEMSGLPFVKYLYIAEFMDI